MEKDIVPGLLEIIEKEFDEKTYNSEVLKKTMQALKDNKATYKDANDFAIEAGEILSKVFKENITAEILPDGKMYYNIADRILNPTMGKNHELIASFAADVQTELNHNAGLKIKGLKPELNQDRIDGIINRVSDEEDFEKIKWILDEPIKNFSQSIVDDTIKTNAKFHAKVGLKPKIIRRSTGKCCDWCEEIAGVYEYPDVPEDVYRRHSFCRCTVTYEPKKGVSTAIHSGTEGKRRYVKDQYGGYELSKEARIERAEERAKTEKERKAAARQKRIDTWARKKAAAKEWTDPKRGDKIEARKQIGIKDNIKNRQIDKESIEKHVRENIIPNENTVEIKTVKQNRHIEGTDEYNREKQGYKNKKEFGPSRVTIGDEEILKLINTYKGTGELRIDTNGTWQRVETIKNNDKIIGVAINNLTGKEAETSVFKIHYADDGVHISPDYPSKKKRR